MPDLPWQCLIPLRSFLLSKLTPLSASFCPPAGTIGAEPESQDSARGDWAPARRQEGELVGFNRGLNLATLQNHHCCGGARRTFLKSPTKEKGRGRWGEEVCVCYFGVEVRTEN